MEDTYTFGQNGFKVIGHILLDILSFQIVIVKEMAAELAEKENITEEEALKYFAKRKREERSTLLHELYEEFGDLPPDIERPEG